MFFFISYLIFVFVFLIGIIEGREGLGSDGMIALVTGRSLV